MGKSNKPNKWFKAVKNAFRSPSKERPQSPDHQGTKVDADEKLLVKHDLSPAPYQAPTPHPLPSYEIITHEEVEPEITSRGQPLPTPEAVAPAMPIKVPEKELENVIEEENTSSNIDAEVVEKHQDDDDDSTLSEEEEAAARIQQRFSEPLALKGLIRLQALVRGHEVRRQAATTLQTMEAIVRVQATFRGRRVRVSKDGRAVRSRISKRRRLSLRANPQDGDVRRGTIFQDKEPEETRAFEDGVNKSKRSTAYLLTQQLKRSTPNRSLLFIDSGPGQPHWGWEWLELWSNARIWEIRTVERPKGSKSTNDSSKDSKDYIEIIPGPRKNSSEYTTKEVDVNTLKVKYYEDYVSNPTPAPMSRSSNPSSEKKEHTKSSSPMSEKQELAKASSHIVPEKKEPTVIRPPRLLPEKKEPGSIRSSTSSPLSEKKEPGSVRSSTSSPLSEKKEPGSIRSSTSGPLSEKKEPVSVRSSTSGPLSEKKEPVSVRSSTSSALSEKKEPVSVRSSTSSPLSEKKEPVSVRSSTSSPLSEKKEPSFSRSTPSPFSEKKDSSFSRSTPSPLSQRNEPARSSTSSLFEKKELDVRSPSSSDFSEKREADYVVSDWQHTSPVATPASPASSTGHSYRTISKPPPIEVPTRPNVVEEDRPSQVETRTLEDPKSPIVKKLAPPSPAVSETPIPALPSSQASGSSFPVPETPPGLDSAGDDPSEIMEHLALPDLAQSANGGETNGAFKSGEAYSSDFSASNGEHQLGEDTASVKGSATASALDYVVNGHPSNGHQENGDSSKSRKGEKVGHGENGESPNVPSKRPTSHYMEPTVSAKARQRSSSNPKVRAPDTPESPARTPKRFSIGGSPVTSKKTDSPKTVFGTRKSTSTFQNRGSPSPKAVTPKEKPGRSGETRAESPARRNSLGSADGKRWRT